MMGTQAVPERLFYGFCLEDHVPDNHLVHRALLVGIRRDQAGIDGKPFAIPGLRPGSGAPQSQTHGARGCFAGSGWIWSEAWQASANSGQLADAFVFIPSLCRVARGFC